MNVTVLGGGNIGMCLVGEISRIKDYDVTIFASHPETFAKVIQVVDDEKHITYRSGEFRATDSLQEAVQDADVILCTLPAFLRRNIIEQMTPWIKETALLGFFPGYGGAEFFCESMLQKGVTIFGLQKVPYVARTKERGKIAGLMSKKQCIYASSIPNSKSSEVAALLEDMLLMECKVLPNYMAATLLPGNPLLHTAGSYVYLRGYQNGSHFPKQIYYYQSWDDNCSDVICRMSDEMRAICNAFPIDLSDVQTIQEYYESPTPEALTKKFHSIPSFYPLILPMLHDEEGFVPDFSSRFYTEDIPFGLCILKGLALIVDVETPMIDEVLHWYKRMTGKCYFHSDNSYGKDIQEAVIPQMYGLNTPEDVLTFYMR